MKILMATGSISRSFEVIVAIKIIIGGNGPVEMLRLTAYLSKQA